MSEFRRGLLDLLELIHLEQKAQGRRLEEITRVCVETADEIRTVRSRLIEQADRHGQEIHEQAKRIVAVERRLDAEGAEDDA